MKTLLRAFLIMVAIIASFAFLTIFFGIWAIPAALFVTLVFGISYMIALLFE